MLRAIDVSRESALLEGVWSVYLSVFPKYERRPKEAMIQLVERNPDMVILTAYLEEGCEEVPQNVKAMSYVINFPSLPFTYLLFLGVDEAHQGEGIGEQVLDQIKQRYEQPILLDVEVIDDPLAKNPEQRQARWRFYQRNGFVRTDHNLYYGKETFQVLSWGFEATKEQVADLALQKDNLFEDPTLSTVWESCEE